jgi:uncharacterized membrane protein YbaN (DUF454 family)
MISRMVLVVALMLYAVEERSFRAGILEIGSMLLWYWGKAIPEPPQRPAPLTVD